MPRNPQSHGKCAWCGEEFSKRAVSTHFDKCPKWQEALRLAESSDRPVETLWRLRVQDAYNNQFWLDLEMAGSVSLDKLDKYLRAIWLECCGHLSQFTIGSWGGREIAKTRKADALFAPELILRHLYDFGDTSETDIRVIGSRKGKAATKHPITLLARNLQPEALCQECAEPASWLCMECIIEHEGEMTGLLCDEHVEEHPHDNYGEPHRLVNSPRMGMCGYDGPAEPPY
jgi:hypothetical protein